MMAPETAQKELIDRLESMELVLAENQIAL